MGGNVPGAPNRAASQARVLARERRRAIRRRCIAQSPAHIPNRMGAEFIPSPTRMGCGMGHRDGDELLLGAKTASHSLTGIVVQNKERPKARMGESKFVELF